MNLTIDVGTTNTKLSLWEEHNPYCPVEEVKCVTPKITNDEGINFDIERLIEELYSAIKELPAKKRRVIKKIAIASVGEAGVLVDQEDHTASSMIAWFDKRSQSIIEELSPEQKHEIYSITGLPAHVHYSASKMAWLLRNEVDSSKNYVWMCIPDYICYKLSGIMATEYSIASRTMVYDICNRCWSDEIKKIFKIQNVTFPEVKSAGTELGKLCPNIASKLGLSTQVGVVIAGHDHMVGSLVSQQKNNEILDSTGTTEGILLLSDNLQVNREQEQASISYGIYVEPKYYTVFTALPSAGSVVQWFITTFNLDSQQFDRIMENVYHKYLEHKICLENIVWFIPHFNGSGSPTKSIATKGMLYGITTKTNIEDLLFGMFLGLTFELKNAIDSMKATGVNKIKLIGPATLDPLWIQLRADLLNLDVEIVDDQEAVSQGANLVLLGNEGEKHLSEKKLKKYVPQHNSAASRQTRQILNIYQEEYLPLYNEKVNLETE